MKKQFLYLIFFLLSFTVVDAQICYDTIIDFDAGSYPVAICIDDFNSDGKLDIASANYSSWNLSVVMGNGDGTFGAPYFITSTNTTYGPESIISADFNGDGKKDLATSNFKPDTLSIFLNNGVGAFIQDAEISLPGPIRRIATTDFNADGKPDLVALRTYGAWAPNVFVMLNTGTDYTPPINLVATDYPTGLTTTDMNNDGFQDIVVSSGTYHSVFLGTGLGSFGGAINSTNANTFVQNIDHADFNTDGNQDIVMADGTNSMVWIYFGNGGGGLSLPVNPMVPGYNKSVLAADFNNDSKMDIASANYPTNDFSILLGNGNGTFQPPANFPVYDAPDFIKAADFNSDGKLDVAISNYSIPVDNSSVMLNIPGPTVTAAISDSVKCWGHPYTLSGGGADSYVWYGSAWGGSFPNGVPVIPDPDTSATFTVTGTLGYCTATASVSLVVYPKPKQSICVVTTDSANADHNVIIWEKEFDDVFDSIFIYREITLNNYQKIGAVHYDSLSLFEDFGANPNTTSYKYKLAVLDKCDSVMFLSNYHNSIHLQYFGLGNFQWTYYEIEGMPNQVSSYNFYRDDNATGNFQLLNVIPGGNHTYTDINYNSFPNALYRVDLEWIGSHECTPTRSEGSTSRSNIKGQVEIGIESNSLEHPIKAFPNPSTGNFNVTIPAEWMNQTLIVTDALGKVVFTSIVQNQNIQLDLTAFDQGIYFLKICNGQQSFVGKLIKQ